MLVSLTVFIPQFAIMVINLKESGGECLSVIIFNTVMNILVDTITQSHHHLGCSLSSINQSCNLLQPLMSTTYKKLQCATAASLLSSRDSMVHHLASQKTLAA